MKRTFKKIIIGLLMGFGIILFSSLSGDKAPSLSSIRNPKITFRVMSYNIHYGRGTDGKVDLQRIANLIRDSGADIIGLNEVDRYFERSGRIDQIKWLADQLNMYYDYQGTFQREATVESGNKKEEHGHAILSKYPIEFSKPRLYTARDKYRRGILESMIILKGQPVYFYVTHWSMGKEDTPRLSQAEETLEWMEEEIKAPKLLVGDLNATPDSREIKKMLNSYKDAFHDQPLAYTFLSNAPSKRIDYILGKGLKFKNSRVINTLASDHLPVVSDVILMR